MQTPPPLPPSKPKSLLVFGVLNILPDAFALMTAVPGVFMMLRPEQNADNPVIQVMQCDATYVLFQKAIMVPGLASTIVLQACASGW